MTLTLTIITLALLVCTICNIITAIAALSYFRASIKMVKESSEMVESYLNASKREQEEIVASLTAGKMASNRKVN